MTRLAIQHGAVNLSQGFPNEAPPEAMALAACGSLISGESYAAAADCAARLADSAFGGRADNAKDMLSQYNFPFGLPVSSCRGPPPRRIRSQRDIGTLAFA